MKPRHASVIATAALLLLTACGGGGGSGGSGGVGTQGSASEAIEGIDSSRPPVAYADAEQIFAFVTAARIPQDGRTVIDFQVTDQDQTAIVDLTAADFSVIVAKLQSSPIGNLTGTWQSYINRIEVPTPGVGTGTEPRLQATTERGSSGEFTNNSNGTYRYRFAASVNIEDQPEAIAEQAQSENLNLNYQPQRTHRVVMQFANARQPANPSYDWVPASGAVDYIFHQDIAATENCNGCHDKLAFHGGGRVEVKYCVTCHNAGTTDANSTNTVDFKVMVHKIHRGAKLPSVQAGEPYVIYGNRDTPHDYSYVEYPNDILSCANCHAGTGSDPGDGSLVLTPQGDNWSQYSTAQACGSCHDGDPDFFANHYGGQPTNQNCMSCHGIGGAADTVANTHVNAVTAASAQFAAEILSVTRTAPGERPEVTFRVYNPEDGSNYDILNDSAWQDPNARLAVKLGWSTTDYTNVGNGLSSAATVSADAKTSAEPAGDGSFAVRFDLAIPNGALPPFIAATGSGVAVIEGRARLDLDGDDSTTSIPLTNATDFFSIDEANGVPVPRRQSVELANCNTCHGSLAFHGGTRSNNIDSCLSCHNPRYTKGSGEGSVNFKVIIHRLHAETLAASDPDDPSTRYPGRLSNCLACHNDQGYQLPLPGGVLATTINPGSDPQDPRDDTVITPISSSCNGCHSTASAQAHMEANGGNFATTQAAIDAGEVVEQCTTCHGQGRTFSLDVVHSITP